MIPPLPPEVAAYLDAATRLLPPAVRGAARAELHANLHQAMLDHLTAGGPAGDAWERAVREAGPAGRVALGLARTHTLPLLWRTLLLAGALGGAASALWSPEAGPAPTHHEARP